MLTQDVTFKADDVAAILRERGWLAAAATPEIDQWLDEAAALLGAKTTDRKTLETLLELVFHYDAPSLLETPESYSVLARVGAREVIRELAFLVLGGPEIDSDHFKVIVDTLKTKLRYRGRELFHPLRLALAGRAGEGELDRVVLLLDRAAALPFPVRVKGTRRRMLEFCATLE